MEDFAIHPHEARADFLAINDGEDGTIDELLDLRESAIEHAARDIAVFRTLVKAGAV